MTEPSNDIATPRVSIIMATYNRGHLIEESLISIIFQSFRNWECIIIDDGSIDDTAAIILPYIKSDHRIKYYNRELDYKKGLPGCRNMGVDLAKGDYIIFFDDDDIVHPQNLELCVFELDKGGFDYCRFLRNPFWGDFNMEFEKIEKYHIRDLTVKDIGKIITNKIPFNSCQVMWRKECLSKNKFNETLMYAEEWECYSRILADGAKGISIKKVLFYGRKHQSSNTGEFMLQNSVRKASKIKASELVIKNLNSKGLFTHKLSEHFISLGFNLKAKSVIMHSLTAIGATKRMKWKYRITFYFYPIIRPLFILKGIFLRHLPG